MSAETEKLTRLLEELVGSLPMKDAGLLLIRVAETLMKKQTSYAPSGASLMRLSPTDGSIVICLGTGTEGQMLSTAYDAVKLSLGLEGP